MKNVGKIDRIIRIVIGLTVIAWGVFEQNWLGAIGLVFLLTGVIRWCPAYLPFGIKTGATASSDPTSIAIQALKISVWSYWLSDFR